MRVMKAVPRGGKVRFVVESKSFEILIDESGDKLRGCIWERSKGITSWIRFGDVSLGRLLAGVEFCCRGGDDKGWSHAWEEEGRSYRLEKRLNQAGRFIFCSVRDVEAKRFCLIFPEGKGLSGGWNILAEKLRVVGVVPIGSLKTPLLKEVQKKDLELETRTYADVTKSRAGKIGDKVWLEVGRRVKPERVELLDRCLVGRWENGVNPSLELDFLKHWAGQAWLLKGNLNIDVLGGGFLLFEFECSSEAERVLSKGKRRVKDNELILEKWHPMVGCLGHKVMVKEAWVRVVGLPLHLWSREVFKLIGDGCGGLINVDEKTFSMANLQWARLLVRVEGRDFPSSVQLVERSGYYSIQLWWEVQPWYSHVMPVGSGCWKGDTETEDEEGSGLGDVCRGNVLEKEAQLVEQMGIQSEPPCGSSSKGATVFSMEPAARGLGVEETYEEDRLENRRQGAGKVVIRGGVGLGPAAIKVGPENGEAQIRSRLGVMKSSPDREEAQLFGPEEAKPIILKGWQMGCEEKPFYIKGSLVGWAGLAEMGCGPAKEGLKGIRAFSLADEVEMGARATEEDSRAGVRDDEGVACCHGGDQRASKDFSMVSKARLTDDALAAEASRTFTQVSVQWQDTDSMREELDDLQIFLSTRWAILLNLHVEMFRVNNVEDILQVLIVFAVESLELDFALLFPERHILLRVLPVLVVLATSSEKDSESLYKRVKINRLINIFKNDPVIPAFPDLHLSPAAILKELAMYFQKFSTQTRLLTLPSPHELPPREAQDYQRHYLIINHIGTIRSEHDDFTVRFALSLNQLLLLKSSDSADVEWCKEVKGNMYDMVVEGFQLLSRWTARIWEQCAWKFSRPCKVSVPMESYEASGSFSDYEKVVRYNYSAEERKGLVELVSYIKSIGSMMQRCDTLVADALWETIHAEVQDFVQNTLATMLRTTFRKKKDLSRILSDMRTLSADWMANTSRPESDLQPLQHGGEESRGTFFHPRPVAPTSAQVHCLQFLIYEVVSGGNLRKPGGLFGNSGSEIPVNDLKQLETFFYKLSFFLHVLDYTVTVATLTDLGFLWFREFYLESSRVIQFPIECSLPWMLVDHVLDSQNAGLLESILMPFDIYNDSAQQALVVLKQRFLYDEIEAEVDHCFDIFVSKLCDNIFTYYKSWAASELLDPSFLFALDNGEKYSIQPMRFTALLKMTRVKLLGRTIDLRSLIAERMNKVFRENLEFLFDRFESQDLCCIVELEKLLDVLKHAHELLSKDLLMDAFNLMLSEMQENISLVSYSSRLASQIWMEMRNDFLPNFILCNTTQRFVRSSKVPSVPVQRPSVPSAKPNFYCGTQDLNSAHQTFAQLHCGFFGMAHMFSIVRLLGSRSLPWLIRALLDHISNKIATLEPMITGLQEALPKSIGLLPFDGGVTGCMRLVRENLNWGSKPELKSEVLRGIKEIGSVLYWMGLLDIVLREVDTTHFMQTAPWLGLIPGVDGQILQGQDCGDSPVVTLFKSATAAIVSNPGCLDPTSFHTLSKQAEAADLLCKANMNTGSVLEYALAFTSAALDKYCSKWSAAPKTGFLDITTSKDFYRIFSGLQIGHLEESVQLPPNNHEILGDSVAWGGCTIIYLLGQQLHFELFDFSYQVLNVAEVEVAALIQTHKNPHLAQGWESLLEAMKKARRLNNHVFSMLKARCPLEDKVACAIKQSGAPLHRIKFENTVSAFETLPQKGV